MRESGGWVGPSGGSWLVLALRVGDVDFVGVLLHWLGEGGVCGGRVSPGRSDERDIMIQCERRRRLGGLIVYLGR